MDQHTSSAKDSEALGQVEPISQGGSHDHVETTAPDEEEAIYWDSTTWINLTALCFADFSATFSITLVPSAIAYIVARFPEDAGIAAWIASAMTMVAAILVLPFGEFVDIFGRKKTLLVLFALGFIGMMIAGRASSLKMVIVGQAFNGLGLSATYIILPVIYEIVPKRHRPLTGVLTGCTVGCGFVISPIIEGICIKRGYGGPLEGWRTGIYISAALYGVSFCALLLGFSPSPRILGEGLSTSQRFAKMDWIAIFLLASGLSLFLTGLGIGGYLHPWASATTLCCLIIGFLLCLATCARIYFKKDSILPHRLFEHRNFATTLVVRATGSFAQLACGAYLPQVVVYLFEADGLLQAVWTLPFSLALIAGAVTAGIIFWWTKEGRWIAVIAMGVLALGSGIMLLVKADWTFAQFIWPTIILGASVGMEGQVLNIIAALATPDEYTATAVSAASLCASLGSSVGITIFGQIFTSKLSTFLPAYVSRAVLAAGLSEEMLPTFLAAMAAGNSTAYTEIPGVTPEVLSALGTSTKDAYAESFKYIWYALLAFALATFLIALLFKSTVPQMTAKVSSPAQETMFSKIKHHHHTTSKGG